MILLQDELSGADIKAMCTEAGLLALRERRMRVTQADFKKSRDKVRASALEPVSAAGVLKACFQRPFPLEPWMCCCPGLTRGAVCQLHDSAQVREECDNEIDRV